MKKFYQVTLFSLSILFAGCASIDSGYITDSTVLQENNFDYVKRNIQGEAAASYAIYWLIGGTSKNNLVEKAKADMLASSPLKENESITNLSVFWDTDMVLWGIYAKTTCRVTADVIAFR